MSNVRAPWWFSCYPKSFRDRYGDEMLEIIEELKPVDRGLLSTVQFWFDLLSDMAISIPRMRLLVRTQTTLETASAHGGPSFALVEHRRPGVLVFLFSAAVSLILFHAVQTLHPCPNQPSFLPFTSLQHVVDGVFALCKD